MIGKIRWQLAIVLGGFLSMHCGQAPAVGGTGGTGGSTGGTGGTGGSLPGGGQNPTLLPTVSGTCPTLRTGNVTVTLNGVSMGWQIWAGTPTATQHGPAIIYWHATGSNSGEATTVLTQTVINEVVSLGGIVASGVSTTTTGLNTGNNVWYRGDFNYADQIVACAIQQLHIDTKHIHVGGYSAGALQTVANAYDRSGYVASVVSYSGGYLFSNEVTHPLKDPNYLPPGVASHGAQGSDAYIIDFFNASHSWETNYKAANTFIIDCNDGGNHVAVAQRTAIAPQVWQFFKDHPYKVNPEPYTSLPGWPSYCSIP